ncbi:MAG: CdaR family protein [Thermodesulfobacteriota bacterium]
MAKLVREILSTPLPEINWPKDWHLRLLSFLFAMFLWYFVVGEDKVDTTVIVPVEILNLPQGLVIANPFKKQLEVTVNGPRSVIRALGDQNLTRAVDLTRATPGPVVIQNQTADIRFPRGVTVQRIQPSHINLLLDTLIRKELPIRPLADGQPAEGFVVHSVTVEPAKLDISGPKSFLSPLDYLTTDPIDVRGLSASTTRLVHLALNPSLSELIGDTVVTAQIAILEKTEERLVRGVPVRITGNGPSSVVLKPERVDIRAELPLSVIKGKKDLKSMFSAAVAVDGLTPGSQQRRVDAVGPERTRILAIEPPEVTVELPPSSLPAPGLSPQ